MSDNVYSAIGRRKSASARVRIKKGSGNLIINGKPGLEYLASETLVGILKQPLQLTGLDGQFDIHVNVAGGGKVGQVGAIRHGVSRALLQYDEDLRKVLKQSGMLTRDARVKERKKAGQPGARKRFQFSKR